jgi:hypothetical protein
VNRISPVNSAADSSDLLVMASSIKGHYAPNTRSRTPIAVTAG